MRVPSQAPSAVASGRNQYSRTIDERATPRSAEITVSRSVIGASSAIADLMSIASATSGVATIGKPKPSAPWPKPATRQARAPNAITAGAEEEIIGGGGATDGIRRTEGKKK